MFVDSRQHDVGRGTLVGGVGFVRACGRGGEHVGPRAADEIVEFVLVGRVGAERRKHERVTTWFTDEQVRDQLVATALLVLLAARMEVAGGDGGERRGPLPRLAETLGEQLVVPQPDGLEPIAPAREHADRRGHPFFGEVRHAHEPQHGIVGHGCFAKPPVHRRRTFEQPHDVDADGRGRKEAHRGEHGEAAAHTVGDVEHVGAADRPGEIGQPARAARDRHDPFGQERAVVADRVGQGREKQPRRHGRLQRAAALADHEERPAVKQVGIRGLPLPCRAQQVEQALRGVVVDVEPLERQPGPAAALAARELVVKGVTAGLEERPRAHVRPADAEHHDPIDRLAEPPGRAEDGEEFARGPVGVIGGQEPVGEIDERGVERLAGPCAAGSEAIEIRQRLGPGLVEPRVERREVGGGDPTGREHSGRVVVDRILGRLRADDAHGCIPTVVVVSIAV